MRECIFHFKVIRKGETKLLRALIMLPPDKDPTIADFIAAFGELGYKVELENERELIFRPEGKGDYLLDITRIAIKGETEDAPQHDGELRAILEHMVTGAW